jgi:uncharacterized protein YjiS (DUF1127 family)
MRNIYQEDGLGPEAASGTDAGVASRPPLSPAVAQLASLAERSMLAESGFEPDRWWNDDPAKRHAVARPKLDVRASRAVRAGLSWLATCIMEGFAIYAESMYPCLVDPARLNGDATDSHATDSHAPERHAPERHAPERHAPESHAIGARKLSSHRQTPDDDGLPWQFADNPWLFEEPRSPTPKTSRIARLWSRMRRRRPANQTGMTLESLDERTLRDIGGDYPDIEKIVWYQDPHAW